jgi:hypothetical protein
MSLVDWRAAPAIALAAVVWAAAAVAGEQETPQEFVLRSLGHIQRGEASAVIPLFAPESLAEISLDQVAGAIQLLGVHDQVHSQLVTQESGHSADGVPIDTVIYHLKGPDSALLAIGQVRDTDNGLKLIGLKFSPAPLDLSEIFPFVMTGISYVHYYVLIALLFVPALMLYATVVCLRRESGAGWAWIPFILIGIGRATALWIPGSADDRLFSFVPMAVIVLGVEIQKVAVFEPWQVSVSAPVGAILYLSWTGRTSRTRLAAEPQTSRTPDSQSA